MKFNYRAFDIAGKEHRDVLEAGTLPEAEESLRRRGLFIAEISSGGLGEAESMKECRAISVPRGRTQRLRDLTNFTRQLAVLVSTGTTIVEAISSLERQLPEGEWKSIVGDIRKAVEEGRQLSEAMARHPKYFDGVCRSLVAAGESGGQIDTMLKRLSELTRRQLKIRSTVQGAMVYPVLLIFVSFGVMGAMFGFVLPRFEGLFKSLDAPLPPTTRVLMGVGAWTVQWWWAVLITAVLALVGTKYYLSTPGGRRWWHEQLVRLPQVGRVIRMLATARIARVLGVLMEGKVPLLEALQLARDAAGNLCYADLIAAAEDRVVRGENISAAFAQSRLISPSVTEAVRSGERTGRLADVLTHIADYLDEDNEVLVRSLTSILEPVILLTLGVVVGFVAISMFLPLFDLTATAGRGG